MKRERDEKTTYALNQIHTWMMKAYPDVRLLIDPETKSHIDPVTIEKFDTFTDPVVSDSVSEGNELKDFPYQTFGELSRTIDFVISLGGDGTLLKACSMFLTEVPPILAFHMGTLGFMTSGNIENFREEISRVMSSRFQCSRRMRLNCSLLEHENNRSHEIFACLNEVSLHSSSRDSVMISLDLSLDNRSFTTFNGDGLIISTATGSSAYSLSCGGPIMHPECTSICITPIAPTALSFRPILIPSNTIIEIMEGKRNRSDQIRVSFDGRHHMGLNAAQSLQIRKSEFPANIVCIQDSMTDWIGAFRKRLNWV